MKDCHVGYPSPKGSPKLKYDMGLDNYDVDLYMLTNDVY